MPQEKKKEINILRNLKKKLNQIVVKIFQKSSSPTTQIGLSHSPFFVRISYTLIHVSQMR